MHERFLATPLFTETIPQGVLIIIEGGKVQYITKQEEKNVPTLASGSLIRQKWAKFSRVSIGQK